MIKFSGVSVTNMEYLAFLLVFTMFWKMSLSVMCYKCEAERSPYFPNTPLCEHFNYSEKFLVNCDSSNMCFKRVTFLNLGNGLTAKLTKRGCAAQTMSGDQEKKNGKWIYVKNIYDVYNETCSEDPSDSERVTKTVHCYCSGDLCNAAGTLTTSISLIAVIILRLII